MCGTPPPETCLLMHAASTPFNALVLLCVNVDETHFFVQSVIPTNCTCAECVIDNAAFNRLGFFTVLYMGFFMVLSLHICGSGAV